MLAHEVERARTSPRRRSRRLVLEQLEERRLLTGNPPFAVGGDPIVNPADFRVTTFASGLNYPHGMLTLSDGSLLVAVNNPISGTSFYNTTGQLLRFVDANGDGVADGAGQVLYNSLPGGVTALHQAGEFILATSSASGNERISVLRTGATVGAPLTLVGSINFSFPTNWEHTSFASVVRPTPGQSGNFDVIFNIGSQYNGVVIGGNGSVVLDNNGNPTYQPSTGTVRASGLISGTLVGDSLYMITLHDDNHNPVVSNLTRIASGLRNAASLAIDPTSGDLYLADNGIDGNNGGNEAWSADELNRIPKAQIGVTVPFFGFPEVINGQLTYSYVKTIDKPGEPVTVVNSGVGVQPLVAFQPLPDAVLTAEGSESEGPSGFALSPSGFPAGLNHGAFIGFHGVFDAGGTANDENPLVFANPSTGHYFDFVSNNESGIGHIDEILSTPDSLYLADIASGGSMGSGAGQGVIYQIKAITNQIVNHPPVLGSIADQTVDEGTKLTVQASATDPDPNQTITYSLGPGAPAGASIGAQSGTFTWTPNPYSSTGTYSITVVATDNGSPPLSDSIAFTANVLSVNHPPNLQNIPAQVVEQGQPLQVKVRDFVSDPDIPAQALSYSLAPGAPSGASIDATGLFTWTPNSNQPINAYTIGVVVTDNGSPPLSGSKSFTVNVGPFNHPPVLSTIPTQSVDEGNLLTIDLTATDSDVPAQSINFTLGAGTPAGAAIDSQSHRFIWTPDAYSGSGTYSITIIATDNGYVPKSDSTTFTVNVLPVNHPPVVAAIPTQTAVLKQKLQLNLARYTSDPDTPAQMLAYSLVPGAPAGVIVDPVSGLLTWTLSSRQRIGTYSIGVVVSDSGSPQLSQTTSVTVNVFDVGPAATIARASVSTKNGLVITLKFSQPLDPSTAKNANNYVLVPIKLKNSKQPTIVTPIPLSANYNASTNTVTLTSTVRVKARQSFKLTVIGTGPDGIANVTGLLMAGVRKRAGTNYVASITGKSIRQINKS